MVQEHPLVALTGSGGVGKTRISIQVAREMLETFPDGAWLVELAPVSDPDQVPNAVANAFNLREGSRAPDPGNAGRFLTQETGFDPAGQLRTPAVRLC